MARLITWLDQWAGPIALQVAVAVTLMLAVALLVSWGLRRSAASLRHRVWALAILSLLAYPLVQPLLPKVSLGLRLASSENPSDAGPTATSPLESPPFPPTALPVQDQRLVDDIAAHANQATAPLPVPKPQTADDGGIQLPAVTTPTRASVFHWPSIIAAIWAIGTVIGLGFLVKVHLAAWRLVLTATIPSDPSWTELTGVLAAQLGVRRRVAVRISDRIAVPVTAGWIRPAILLPSGCDGWAGSRRRMVLIHELSHVARGDVLWQIAAKLACVMYWPHPLVWLAARRMRVEREAACDDAVLRDVERPSEYASLLLDVAASLADRPIGMGTAAVAMAGGRSVEERIRWIVQPGRCRLPIGQRTARWFSVGAILIVLGLGSISIFAGPPVPTESEPTTGGQRSDKERLRRTELEQHQSSPATTAERSPWYVALPNGATVELIGLAPNPSDEKPWWQPDGSLLLERPFANKHKLVFNNENRQAVDVAYRITWPDSGPSASTNRITGNLGIGSTDTMRGKNGVSGMAVVFPAAQATTDIYLGAAAGPWELAVKLGPNGGKCKRPDLPAAEFTSVEQRNGEFVVEGVLSWTWDDEFNYHLVVVGEDGSEHVFSDSRAKDVKPEKKVRHWTFHDPLTKISEHPLTAIKEMRLEYRRYQFAEFKSVSLRAGVKTHVLTDAKADVFSRSDQPKATASANVEKGPILRGRIVDESGNPLPGVHIVLYSGIATRWRGQEANTNANGEYQFDPLKTGAARLKDGRPSDWYTGVQFEHDECVPADGRSWRDIHVPMVDRHEHVLDMKMVRGGKVSGIVVDADTGKPVGQLDLRIDNGFTGGKRDGEFTVYATTDNVGWFTSRPLFPGRYVIQTNDAKIANDAKIGMAVVRAGETTEIRMTTQERPDLQDPFHITGTAIGDDGHSMVYGGVGLRITGSDNKLRTAGGGIDGRNVFNLNFGPIERITPSPKAPYGVGTSDVELFGWNTRFGYKLVKRTPSEPLRITDDPNQPELKDGIRYICPNQPVEFQLVFAKDGGAPRPDSRPVPTGSATSSDSPTDGLAQKTADPAGLPSLSNTARLDDLQITVTSDRHDYFLGENVILHYLIEYRGQQPMTIDMGGDNRNNAGRALRFKVEAIDQTGRLAPDPYTHPGDFGGLGGPITLKPGDQFCEDLRLMRYCEPGRSGTYSIKVYHDLGLDQLPPATAYSRRIGSDIPAEPHKVPVVSTTIRFQMPTVEQARQVVDATLKLPTDWNRSFGKRGRPFADFAVLRYPVYLPMMRDLAESGDARGLEAIGAMAFPEATEALLELCDSKNPVIAAKAQELLLARIPVIGDSRPSRESYLADHSWQPQLKAQAMQLAWRLLGTDDREAQIRAARIVRSISDKQDLPRLIGVMDKLLPAYKDNDVEQRAWLRPASVCDGLTWATRELIKRGASPPSAADTPGRAVAFLIGLQSNKDFRPPAWHETLLSLLKSDIPFLRALAVSSTPLPLSDDATRLVAERIEDTYPPVQAAACYLAGQSKMDRFRQPVVRLLQKTVNEWILDNSFRAAKNCGARTDRLEEILVGRLEPGNNDWNMRVLGLMIETTIKHEGGSGAQTIRDWQPFFGGLQAAWRKFIEANRDALEQGRLIELGDPTITPEMFPPGYYLYLQGQPWPSEHSPFPARPVTKPATSASSSQSGNASNPLLQEFRRVYALPDGQVIKRVAPPFSPGRLEYYRVHDAEQAKSLPQGPEYMWFRWDQRVPNPRPTNWDRIQEGRLTPGGMGWGGGKGMEVAFLVESFTGIRSYEMQGDQNLIQAKVPGDWVVRDGIALEQILRGLEDILQKQCKLAVRLRLVQQDRKVIVAEGSYAYRPLPGRGTVTYEEGSEENNWREGHYDQVDVFAHDRSGLREESCDNLAGVLRHVSYFIGRPVLDEVSHPPKNKLIVKADDALRKQGKLDEATILRHLSEQTGLTFSEKTRRVRVLLVEHAE